MKKFRYGALDAKGEQTGGSLRAASEAEAIQWLRARGLYPTQIAEVGKGSEVDKAEEQGAVKQGAKLVMPALVYAIVLVGLGVSSIFGIWWTMKVRGDDCSIVYTLFVPTLSALILSLYTPFTLRRGVEWLGWMLLVFVQWFYYKNLIASGLDVIQGYWPFVEPVTSKLVNWQNDFWSVVRQLGPNDWPFTTAASLWPIYFHGIGLAVRAGIYRWGGFRFMIHARAYWLWITLYVVALKIFSDISAWSFFFLFSGSVLVLLLVIAGASQVVSDIARFLWDFVRLALGVLNVLCRWGVYVAIWLAAMMRRFIRRIRLLYDRYFAQPLRRAIAYFEGIVGKWRQRVISKTQDLDESSEDG